MTFFKSTIVRVATVFAFVLSFTAFTNAPAQAQSVCKGLSKSACTSNSRCSHVAAFTRSDGARVKAFCRAKPGSGAKKTAKSSSSKKKVATKASSKTAKAPVKKASTKKTTTKRTTTKKSTTKTVAAKKKPVKKTKKTTAKKPAKKKKKSTAGTS